MPRGITLAPPSEQHNTLDNIMKDFLSGKARVYRGLPAIRVFADEAKHLPTTDYPYYEHTQYGDEVVSFIAYVGIEEFLKRKKGERVPGTINPKTKAQSYFVREFDWEFVWVDIFMTEHEKAAFDIGDAHNASNLFRSLNREIIYSDETGNVTTFRGNIHDAIVGYSTTPIAVDHGLTLVDIWPSGANQGKYLAELEDKFLLDAVKRGSSPTASDHTQNLGAIALAEIQRRDAVKAEKKTKSESGTGSDEETEKPKRGANK